MNNDYTMNEGEKVWPHLRHGNSQVLRNLLWNSRGNKPVEHGIFLIWRSRYQDSAENVARIVRGLGGTAKVKKAGKMGKDLSRKTWVVRFTVDTKVDQYLMKRINLRTLREWDKKWTS